MRWTGSGIFVIVFEARYRQRCDLLVKPATLAMVAALK
jgi:hypothetical protein